MPGRRHAARLETFARRAVNTNNAESEWQLLRQVVSVTPDAPTGVGSAGLRAIQTRKRGPMAGGSSPKELLVNTSPSTFAVALLITASAPLAACGPIVSAANAHTDSQRVASGSVSGASPVYFGDDYAAEEQKLVANNRSQTATFCRPCHAELRGRKRPTCGAACADDEPVFTSGSPTCFRFN